MKYIYVEDVSQSNYYAIELPDGVQPTEENIRKAAMDVTPYKVRFGELFSNELQDEYGEMITFAKEET